MLPKLQEGLSLAGDSAPPPDVRPDQVVSLSREGAWERAEISAEQQLGSLPTLAHTGVPMEPTRGFLCGVEQFIQPPLTVEGGCAFLSQVCPKALPVLIYLNL